MKIRRFIRKRRQRALKRQRLIDDRIKCLQRAGFQVITLDEVPGNTVIVRQETA